MLHLCLSVLGINNSGVVGHQGQAALPAVPGGVHGALLLHIGAPAARAGVGLPRPAGAAQGRLRNLPGGDRGVHNGLVQLPKVQVHHRGRLQRGHHAARAHQGCQHHGQARREELRWMGNIRRELSNFI